MPYAAKSSAGTVLKVTISGTPTAIPGVQGISGPGGDKEQIEVTALSDTAKKFIAGHADFGSVTFTIFYDQSEASHVHIFTQYSTANTTDALTIESSDNGAANIACAGSFVGWEFDYSQNAPITARVTFRLSGAPTIT
jgi:hypothetical protein